ncbi:MAG: universal stress protein [Pseudomonadales bacterium]
MFEVKHCLVVLDPDSTRQKALEAALRWSAKEPMDFELVACDDAPVLDPGYYFYDLERMAPKKAARDARLNDFLQTQAQPLLEQGLTVTTQILQGHPVYESIVRHVTHNQPDMVFENASYHSRLEDLFLSNRDWQLIKACPAPLLLSKRKQWGENPVIIAAVDPLHGKDEYATLDRQVLYAAKHIVDLFGAELHVFHSIKQVLFSGTPLQEAHDIHEQKCLELLDSVDIAGDQLMLEDLPVQAVLPVIAKELHADLVIMGAVSRSRLGDIFIGNTAEQVLDDLDTDVLVIKPEGFQSPVRALPNPNIG